MKQFLSICILVILLCIPSAWSQVLDEIIDSKSPGGFTITGADAELNLNMDGAGGVGGKLNFQRSGTRYWTLREEFGTLYFQDDETHDLFSISSSGGISHTYEGGGAGYTLSGTTINNLFVVNNNTTSSGKGLWAEITSSSANSNSDAIHCVNQGAGYGLYAVSYNTSGTAALGINEETDNKGSLGTENYGVYGHIGANVPGNAAVYGNVATSGGSGTGYGITETICGVKGRMTSNTQYVFGTAGYISTTSNVRSGGCLGIDLGTSVWGCLSYADASSNKYGGYFTSYYSPPKAGSSGLKTGIGFGASGELFGGTVRGDLFGLYVQGRDFAQYNHGDTYTDGVCGMIHDTGTERITTYAPASATVDAYAYGVGKMSGGRAAITFDNQFHHLVSESEPIIITATPIGQAAEQITSSGFQVRDDRDTGSDVQFTWIAIGKRKGFENHTAPNAILAGDFTENMDQVTHSDVDTSRKTKGIYAVDNNLQFGTPPVENPDQ